MPLVEVIHPEGAFSPEAKSKLLATLSATCLKWEGIAINDASQSIAWVYLDERPKDSISAGGLAPGQNLYLVNVRVMVGFMDYARIDGMVADVTQSILEADGTEGTGAARVYVIINEVPSGTWGVDGKVWPAVFTAETLDLEPDRIKRMAQAIESRPRLDVPLELHDA